jgi:hypothetical protein
VIEVKIFSECSRAALARHWPVSHSCLPSFLTSFTIFLINSTATSIPLNRHTDRRAVHLISSAEKQSLLQRSSATIICWKAIRSAVQFIYYNLLKSNQFCCAVRIISSSQMDPKRNFDLTPQKSAQAPKKRRRVKPALQIIWRISTGNSKNRLKFLGP